VTIPDLPFTDTMNDSRLPVRIHPTVVIGLGDFGGAALCLLADRLRSTHPALSDRIEWLWLTASGWQEDALPSLAPTPTAESAAPVTISSEPLARAFDRATSQETVAALREAGYEASATLSTVVVGHVDDAFTRGALWSLLDLARAQPPLRENRVTMVLACDSRRFVEPSAPELALFFDQLAERLVADRADPPPGAVAWCYLCDTLDVDSRLLGGGGGLEDIVQSQVELVGGFVTLLIGSGLQREPAYARTALPELAHDVTASPDAALVSSFGLGACVLPIDQIAALACDQLALRLYEAAFPAQASVADRDAAWSAHERLLTAADLAPHKLRDRLLRRPDGSPIHFDTTPPDLTGLDPETMLQALGHWHDGLKARWADKATSPPDQIARNADQLLDELVGRVRREVDGLVEGGPRGIHQARALLAELPKRIEEARLQVMGDDGNYQKMIIPSVDEAFRELGEQVIKGSRQWWVGLLWTSGVFLPLVLLALWMKSSVWGIPLGFWIGSALAALVIAPWRYRCRLAQRQADFIAAVQLEYRGTQEREMRTKRRALVDGLLDAVRQESQALAAWQETISAARASLAQADVPSPQLTCGEWLFCDPSECPLPVAGYDEGKIGEIAAHYLPSDTRPSWRDGDVEAAVAWLREGAARALTSWRRANSITDQGEEELSRALDDLASTVRPQWPLAPNERRQVELNVVGWPERDRAIQPDWAGQAQPLAVSTCDPLRLSYACTYHGLRLKELAATRPLWESPSTTQTTDCGPL
jgi:hypothetical protein